MAQWIRVPAIKTDGLNPIPQDPHGGGRKQAPECFGMPTYIHTYTQNKQQIFKKEMR